MKFWTSPETSAISRLPMLGLTPKNRISLNGRWHFQLLKSPEAKLSQRWEEIQVPGLWTRAPEAGKSRAFWDLPHYTNVQMPWDLLPPKTPEINPTGIYEREFSIPKSWAKQRIVLRVGGFESALQVSVNGQEIGASKDGRLHADFELTPFLKRGKNQLRLTVIKWSDATYIEDQDQWWHGGITRNVDLIATPLIHVDTCRITPGLSPDFKNGRLKISAQIAGGDFAGYQIKVSVKGQNHSFKFADPFPKHSGEIPTDIWRAHQRRFQGEFWNQNQVPDDLAKLYAQADRPHPGVANFEFEVANVKAWSAELPTLYPFLLELIEPNGTVSESFEINIGFRDVRVEGNQLLFNGQPIYIYGINRHDFHPETGRVLTKDEIRADLLALKALNYNAIRTSHYPNDPALLEIADELGFYVIEEANIESHAFQDSLCNDLRYQLQWVDRVSRMVQRDIHHPSVIMWSLGNESGSGLNHAAAAAAARKLDSSRPLHYEGAIRFDWTTGQELTDVVCPMYPHIENIRDYALTMANGDLTRPLIMCEYSHAMGNSNGNLAEYWEIIHSTPGLQGGFIWEYWDHGLTQILPDGKSRSAYGGDFGDYPNDGSFVCDGMFWPDRRPKPASVEMAQIAAPVQIERQGKKYFVFNANFYKSISRKDYEIEFKILVDGAVQISGTTAMPHIGPREKVALELVLPKLVTGLPNVNTEIASIGFYVTTKKSTEWLESGSVISFAQFDLPNQRIIAGAPKPIRNVSDWISESGEIAIPGLTSSFDLTLFRAPTENDTYGQIAQIWRRAGLAELKLLARKAKATKTGWLITSTWETGGGQQVKQRQTVTVIGNGLTVSEEIITPKRLTDLPRVGIAFAIPASFAKLEYFGAGPHETYPDRKLAINQRYQSYITDQYIPYIKPQESGGHSDVRWAKIDDGVNQLVLTFDRPIQFSALPYSATEMAAKSHDVDLTPDGQNYLTFDLAHRGVGTASCGPDTLPDYLVGPGIYRLTWQLELTTL